MPVTQPASPSAAFSRLQPPAAAAAAAATAAASQAAVAYRRPQAPRSTQTPRPAGCKPEAPRSPRTPRPAGTSRHRAGDPSMCCSVCEPPPAERRSLAEAPLRRPRQPTAVAAVATASPERRSLAGALHHRRRKPAAVAAIAESNPSQSTLSRWQLCAAQGPVNRARSGKETPEIEDVETALGGCNNIEVT